MTINFESEDGQLSAVKVQLEGVASDIALAILVAQFNVEKSVSERLVAVVKDHDKTAAGAFIAAQALASVERSNALADLIRAAAEEEQSK